MRVAAIDCGTNSIRLLVAEGAGDDLIEVDRRMEIVRLGEGIDITGEFAPAALERTFLACESYAERIAELGVDAIRFVATSASRDARNREDFISGVRERLGVEPEVVSGDQEARLSFTGAVRGLPGVQGRVLVVDIGGGSTEFVLGAADVEQAVSVDIGCVRMTERHLRDDPPTAAQRAEVTADIDAAIDAAAGAVDLRAAGTLIGLAGSVTTVAAIALDLRAYDPRVLHGSVISAEQVHDVTERLLTMRRAERAALPVMHPGRVDVIGGGALILDRIMARTGLDSVRVSETDILDGIAWSLLA